jgi:hypothetical protein
MTRCAGVSILALALAGPALGDVPAGPVEQPPPRADEIEIVGDYAGRMMSIHAGDELLFEGSRPLEPTGVSWRLPLQGEAFPVTLSIRFTECESVVEHEIEDTQMPALLIVRGCDVAFVG